MFSLRRRRGRRTCTATAGASTTSSCGTTAQPCTMRCATTTRTRSGSCTGPPRWVTVRFRRLGRWSAGELVDPLGQRDVEVGETVAIVRRQGNVDAVVDVAPFRVMVQLLRRHSDLRPEAPGLAERLELKSHLEKSRVGKEGVS